MAFSQRSDWDHTRNILCIRLDSLGDVLMTSPAIRALKEGNLERRITLLTSASGAEAARLIPEIDESIVYDAPWLKATAARDNSKPEYAMAEVLREKEFDAVVIFTVFSQNPLPSAFLCYLAEIPLRLAYCRENPYQLLTDWVEDRTQMEAIPHEVRRQLDLVAKIGCRTVDERIQLESPSLAYSQIRDELMRIELDFEAPWVVIHPGATAPSRCYEPESFAKVAGCLVRQHGIQVVFTGSVSEMELVCKIQDAMEAPSISLAGEMDLLQMAALLDLAPLLISNNSGPVHLASGVGTPVVDLYALTNPQHTPWMVSSRVLSHDVPCKYCFHSICREGHHNCLRLVEPEQVVQAALELLKDSSNSQRMTTEQNIPVKSRRIQC